MGTYEELKAAIQQVIKTNGNNEITGALLQQTLLSIVNTVGNNATFAGIATPNTNPGTPDQNIFYLATEAGTYVNFNNIEIFAGEAVILTNKTGAWVKNTSGFATQQQLTELESKTNHKVFSNGVLFNSMFSEVYFVGFTSDEISNITRVAWGLLQNNRKRIGLTLDGVVNYYGCDNYSAGVNYFGLLQGNEILGSKGFFVLSNGDWIDNVEYLTFNSICLDINNSPSIAQKVYELSQNNSILVNLEFAGTSQRIHKDGYIVDASSAWSYTTPIAVTKGDLLKIHTLGNINTAVLAKTDENGSFYETLLNYDSSNDYNYLVDFDGYIALSIYTDNVYHLYKITLPLVQYLVSALKSDTPTVDVKGIESIEQIITSTESGGVNVIECTLTDGTKTQFYIRNGIAGSGESSSVPNFNSVQLLPQPKFQKPLIYIKGEDLAWNPSVASDAEVSTSPREIYDEVYRKMNKVEWVKSLSKALMCIDFPSAIDMTNKVVCGSIYLDENIADTVTMGVTSVRLWSGDSNDYSHRLSIQIQWVGAGYENNQRTGWFHFCVSPEANANEKGASFDITDVRGIAIHQQHTSANVEYGIGDFYIVDGMKKGGVVMLIDNFNPNVPAMADYIASKGLKATLSIVPGWIGNNSLHGTLEQINKCASDGHLIINHTWSHNTSNEQTAEEIFEEISLADKWMVKNGFVRGSKIVSNPSAAHDLNKYRAYMDSEAVMIYHHWTTQGSGDNYTLYYPYVPMSRLLNITALESLGVEYMINAVNKAIEVGGIAVLGWHGTWYDAENGEADFKSLIDHIASLGSSCACYLVDELIEGIYK